MTTNLVGMKWNTVTDEIGYKDKDTKLTDQSDCDTSELHTKREVVKRVASLYDPLGYVSPVHIRAKMLIQEIWKSNLDWDESLPQEIVTNWREIRNDLDHVTDTVLARRYFPDCSSDNNDYELHCFADASMKGYGCATYLVHDSKSSLVMAKNRVAPIKEITLPKLELMAAVIGARLTKFVHTALASRINITKSVLWLDSQIVLHWLRSDKTLPRFIRNRVNEIRTTIPNATFKYCPTRDNPADVLTRGINSKQLKESQLWWNGPYWLKTGDWPVSRLITDTDANEQETAMVVKANPTTNHANADKTHTGITKIIDVNRYSSLTRLRRITALVLRFVGNLRNPNNRVTGEITAREIKAAEKLWIIGVQSECYADELRLLKSNERKHGQLVKQLKLFLDEDHIVRCGGRLHNSPLTETAKFPALIPKYHHFTRLIVLYHHRRSKHIGLQGTVTTLRQYYWIPSIRIVVKSVTRHCVTCKFVIGQSYQAPIRPPLPKMRVTDHPAFTVTGVDFTGNSTLNRKSARKPNAMFVYSPALRHVVYT
ncbi:uncharacterized protein [Ptychodera flava]|uniref:uncharacterized protein n=1 Tax=Ptychodera flava TaxID=63121 RepID=UPI003969DBF1